MTEPPFEPPPFRLSFVALGASSSFFVDAPAGVHWSLDIPPSPWLSAKPISGTGQGLVEVKVARNEGDSRSAELEVDSGAKGKWRVLVFQQPGLFCKTESDVVLELPFVTVPRVMELGIAGKWIAKEIRKIPEPFDLIALIVVVVLVLVLTLLVIAGREALADLVPEPKPVFGVPPLPGPLAVIPPKVLEAILGQFPVTTQFIGAEGIQLAVYIVLQTLNGGE